jgi:hypothetical protein
MITLVLFAALLMLLVPVAASSNRLVHQETTAAVRTSAPCRDRHICYKPDGSGHARYWYNKRAFPPPLLTATRPRCTRRTHGECMVGCFTQEMARQMGFETCGKSCPTVPPKRTKLNFGRRCTCHSCYDNRKQQQEQQQRDVLQSKDIDNVTNRAAARHTEAAC